MNRLGCFNARVQQRYQAVFLLDGRKNIAKLRLIGKVRLIHHLCGSFDVHLRLRCIVQYAGIAQRKGVLCNSFVALALGSQFLQQVVANGFQRPARIMTIQEISRGVQFGLGEGPHGLEDLIARFASGRNEHHDNSPVRKQPHACVLQNGLAQRRCNDDSQTVGDFRKHMAGALRDFRGGFRTAHFVLNPFPVTDADGCLRGNLLRKETVGRRRGDAARRSMRLVKETAIFQIGHHVANCGGAQVFLVALGNGARRHRFPRLNVRTHDVRQNLAVTPFL